MTTRKEKLANKRAEQAARRAEKSKEANAGDQKADQKADPNLDAEIKIVELQLETLRKACNQFIHKCTSGADNVRFDPGWPKGPGYFVGHNSTDLNGILDKKHRLPIRQLNTRLENLLNKKDPGRRARLHKQKEEEKAKQAFWNAVGRQLDNQQPRNEKERGEAMGLALLTGNQQLYSNLAESSFESTTSSSAYSSTNDKGDDKGDTKTEIVETIIRKSAGWIVMAGQKPLVRCYHLVGNEYKPCDCIRDGDHESSTEHQLSKRAKDLQAQGKLMVKDGMAHAQRFLANAGSVLGRPVMADPFGFAGSVLRSSEYNVAV